MTSGHIILLDRDELLPGKEAVVEILFLLNEFLERDLSHGRIVTFGEWAKIIGEIELIETKGDVISPSAPIVFGLVSKSYSSYRFSAL